MVTDFLDWQIGAAQNPFGWIAFFVFVAFIIAMANLVLGWLNRKDQMPDVWLAFKAHPTFADKEFYFSAFVSYFAWAAVQQTFVMLVAYLVFDSLPLRVVLGALFFGSMHSPNWRLAGTTATLGLALYSGFWFGGFQFLPWLWFAHALGGTFYNRTGWSMRVGGATAWEWVLRRIGVKK